MLRTHTCGQLSLKDKDKEVTLCGWVATRRDHGKLIFIDLRDRYGITQVTFIPKESKESYATAGELRGEFVVMVKGLVNPRPANNVNKNLATGEVEILATQVKILNRSLTPPFEIEGNLDVTEDLRLKYRYLDLRRKKSSYNFALRHKLYRNMREFLDKEGFIESETPILTKSTPEGARDYLVPSRVTPGKFFALPQSPQMFKQILMVSGIDKYYQIAKCFRDEDLRADRQPEFTQLDLEMSFVDEEDIFSLIEKLMYLVFKELKGVEIKLPFKRLSYQEAQDKYKSDKPDTRSEEGVEHSFLWIKEFPLFKYNDQEKRWESEHHPFTAPSIEDPDLLGGSPDKIKARSYDLVLNGVELGSGSIRIHDPKLQTKVFEIIGLNPDEARKRFGFLLEAFSYGAPPHGGFAFGIDRLLSIIAGEPSIREVIAFPKTSAAFCPLTEAPSEVDRGQLKELGITVKKQKDLKEVK